MQRQKQFKTAYWKELDYEQSLFSSLARRVSENKSARKINRRRSNTGRKRRVAIFFRTKLEKRDCSYSKRELK